MLEFAIENKLVNRGETIVVISGIGDNFLQGVYLHCRSTKLDIIPLTLK